MTKRKSQQDADAYSPGSRSSKKTRPEALDGDETPIPKPKLPRVPAPRIQSYTPITEERDYRRSLGSLKNLVDGQSKFKADAWLRYAPVFLVPGVRLSRLAARVKNQPKDVAKANKTIKAMSNAEADACSARFVDEDGQTLACVFAHRIRAKEAKNQQARDKTEGKSAVDSSEGTQEIKAYPGTVGRTWEDVDTKRDTYDGISRFLLARSHEATQTLHHHLHPQVHQRDVRHPDEAVLAYQQEIQSQDPLPELQPDGVNSDQDVLPEFQRDGVEQPDTEDRFERTGVTHLVHAWHQQGRKNGAMTMSQDMHGRSCTGEMAVKAYYKATTELALHLKECFRVAYPKHYQRYIEAFEAGVWLSEDPGPWIGRAIVWKLQVRTHVDGLDGGPAAIFNFGSYKGGELYLPDLGVKLRYRAGDLVIFMAGQLYHRISEWTVDTGKANAGVTPGRVGNVFFFPEASLEALAGKPPGWHVDTIGGRAPDSSL